MLTNFLFPLATFLKSLKSHQLAADVLSNAHALSNEVDSATMVCEIESFSSKPGAKFNSKSLVSIASSHSLSPELQMEHYIDALAFTHKMIKHAKIFSAFERSNKGTHYMVKGTSF